MTYCEAGCSNHTSLLMQTNTSLTRDNLAANRPDIIFHLGDVSYADK